MTYTEREMKLSYVAGLFDGEGCIGLYNCRTKAEKRAVHYQLVMRMQQKVPFGVEAMQELWDGNIFTLSNVGPNKPGPYYAYRLTNRQAEVALKELLPYLREKKSQAILALEFCEMRRAQGHKSKVEQRRVTPEELSVRDEYIEKIRSEKHHNFGLDYFTGVQ